MLSRPAARRCSSPAANNQASVENPSRPDPIHCASKRTLKSLWKWLNCMPCPKLNANAPNLFRGSSFASSLCCCRPRPWRARRLSLHSALIPPKFLVASFPAPWAPTPPEMFMFRLFPPSSSLPPMAPLLSAGEHKVPAPANSPTPVRSPSITRPMFMS